MDYNVKSGAKVGFFEEEFPSGFLVQDFINFSIINQHFQLILLEYPLSLIPLSFTFYLKAPSKQLNLSRQEFEENVRATEIFHQFRLLSVLPQRFWEPRRVENAIAILTARRKRR